MGLRDVLGLNATKAAALADWGTQPSRSQQIATQVRAATQWALALSPDQVWHSQPYVRTVVEFLARNIAQLGMHTYRRVSDDQRERVRDNALAMLLRRPNASTTTYELIHGLVCDKALHDRAYWLIGSESDGTPTLTRIPPARVVEHIADDPLGSIEAFVVQNTKGERVRVPGDRVLYFPGWNPTTATGLPTSPLHAIRSVIAEQAAAFEFRKMSWENGGQISAAIERPQGVPWRDGARDRFIEDMRSQFSGKGPRRGGVMLLEDGMKLSAQQFNAHEAEWIDAAKLSLALVAAIYHVNPTMVGLLDNANYSNVREFRRMLYGDTLGPIMASIEDRLNAFLVPRFDDDGELYVEFNIAEKLQGSFEEQASALQTSVGGPWMTRAEARARLNLPPLDGADELIVPLNVTAGGQASPTDSAPPPQPTSADVDAHRKLAPVVDIKARASDEQHDKLSSTLAAFFARQGRVVLSRIGSRDDWWDADRWNAELTDDLHALAVETASIVGRREAARLGFEGSYNEERTLNYLREVVESYAINVNATTRKQLDEQLDADEPNPQHVFDVAQEARAPGVAAQVATCVAGFATIEAGRQVAEAHDVEPMKTWITGPNPRASHAAMSGQSVPVDEAFSNGLHWPAQSGDADEVAGCNCAVEISF